MHSLMHPSPARPLWRAIVAFHSGRYHSVFEMYSSPTPERMVNIDEKPSVSSSRGLEYWTCTHFWMRLSPDGPLPLFLYHHDYSCKCRHKTCRPNQEASEHKALDPTKPANWHRLRLVYRMNKAAKDHGFHKGLVLVFDSWTLKKSRLTLKLSIDVPCERNTWSAAGTGESPYLWIASDVEELAGRAIHQSGGSHLGGGGDGENSPATVAVVGESFREQTGPLVSSSVVSASKTCCPCSNLGLAF